MRQVVQRPAWLRRRLVLVMVVLSLGYLAIGVRLSFLHLWSAEALASRAEHQRHRQVALQGERGIIYDRTGRLLVYNVESERVYPNHHLLGHILGFTGRDRQGLEGLEWKYDLQLSGRPGLRVIEADALGRPFLPRKEASRPATPGHSLVLTIDVVIQHISEQALDQAITKTEAAGGSVIVMNTDTGEILAMATRPDFDPNVFSTHHPAQWRNRPITDPYEPGSVLKVVVAAAALEEGVVTPTDWIDCEDGRLEVAGTVIHDPVPQGLLMFADVIKKSSNIGVIKVAQRLGEERLYQALRRFGFREKTGLGLQGESRGILRPVKAWSRRSLASLAIGQEIAATPLQVITAFSAAVNGGVLMRPYLVAEVRLPDGTSIETISPQVRRRVVSVRTSRTLLRILETVVGEGGTGHEAAVPGYRAAGKTGTSQKVDPETARYSKDKVISSFVGVVLTGAPRLAILVVIDEPTAGETWGGRVAAPVFREIASRTLQYLGIPPEDGSLVFGTST